MSRLIDYAKKSSKKQKVNKEIRVKKKKEKRKKGGCHGEGDGRKRGLRKEKQVWV